jgi:hypothetical protein
VAHDLRDVEIDFDGDGKDLSFFSFAQVREWERSFGDLVLNGCSDLGARAGAVVDVDARCLDIYVAGGAGFDSDDASVPMDARMKRAVRLDWGELHAFAECVNAAINRQRGRDEDDTDAASAIVADDDVPYAAAVRVLNVHLM